MSVRAISAETGISVGAVHRAKRQLEKALAQGKQQAAAVSLDLPTSYLAQTGFDVPQDVRKLIVSVYERAVSAIGRGLLGRGDRDNPWTVISALFAGMFDEYTIEWLNKCCDLRWDQRGQGEAIHRCRQYSDRRQRPGALFRHRSRTVTAPQNRIRPHAHST